jgi:hypothetical protein
MKDFRRLNTIALGHDGEILTAKECKALFGYSEKTGLQDTQIVQRGLVESVGLNKWQIRPYPNPFSYVAWSNRLV